MIGSGMITPRELAAISVGHFNPSHSILYYGRFIVP